MDIQEILVDNLREAMQQAQRYLAFGFTAAVALLTLELGAPVGVSGVPVPADPTVARAILIAAYIGVAFLAYGAVLEIRGVAGRIVDNDVRRAAFLYPTIVTSSDPLLRAIGPIAPAIVYAAFLIIDWWHAQHPTFEFYLPLVFFGLFPYVGVALVVRSELKRIADGAQQSAPLSSKT